MSHGFREGGRASAANEPQVSVGPPRPSSLRRGCEERRVPAVRAVIDTAEAELCREGVQGLPALG